MLFCKKKQYLLDEEDKRQTWRLAAGHYAAAGEAMEAITCYHKCGDHASMLQVIGGFATMLRGIMERDADFILKHIDLLTPQEVCEYPLADFFRAHIYMITLAVEKAEALLINLEKRLLARARPDEATILGDVYVALGFIHMMRNQEDYGGFFQKAGSYLPNGSSFFNKNTLAIGNNSCFAMADNQPGARERMEAAAHQAAPWIAEVLRGCLSGMEYIISAESAFMVCDFEKARQHAYRGIYKARAHTQHDYVCNGYLVLARSGWLQGDLAEMTEQIQNIVAYASQYDAAILEEIRDSALTWYYLQLRDFNRIPQSIISMDYSQRPLLVYGRTQMLQATYLIIKEEYAELAGMLEYPQGLFLADRIWHDRISLFIMLAIGYHHLGHGDDALRAFWTAYDMCHHNKLNSLFIEGGERLLPLISRARGQRKYEFSQKWLDAIYEQIHAFAKKADAVRAEYRRQNLLKPAPDNPLSKRERAVLQALAKGLTREEIALKQYISVNTVKAAIRSIYTKLNANNRAQAVSIAITHGYIDRYMPQ